MGFEARAPPLLDAVLTRLPGCPHLVVGGDVAGHAGHPGEREHRGETSDNPLGLVPATLEPQLEEFLGEVPLVVPRGQDLFDQGQGQQVFAGPGAHGF